MWREQVIAEARSWIGTPYVPKARVKGVGVDCGGLLYEVYNPIFGPFANFPQDYTADWAMHSDRERYLDFIMPYVEEVRAPQPGDFSLYHLGLAYSHAAILMDDGRYVHAWGRTRDGAVTQTYARVMIAMDKKNQFKAKHFTGKFNG